MEMELYAHLVCAAPEAARTRPSSSSPTAPSSTASSSRRFDRSLLLAETPVQVHDARRAARRADQPHHRRHLLHDAAEVRPAREAEKDAGARPPAAVRPAQHHRHRRRGAPQPLRRPRRLRPPPRATPCPTPRSSRSPARRSRSPTATPRTSSATTSTSTTSPAPSTTAPPCRSTSSRGSSRSRSPTDVTEEDLDRAADEATARPRRHRARADRGSPSPSSTPSTARPQRIAALAADLVAHWEDRARRHGASSSTSPGKALIVGGTREICAKLYDGDRRAAARLALRRPRQGQDQGRLLRVRVRPAAGRQARAPRLRRTRRSRSGSRTPTTSSRSSSSRT